MALLEGPRKSNAVNLNNNNNNLAFVVFNPGDLYYLGYKKIKTNFI